MNIRKHHMLIVTIIACLTLACSDDGMPSPESDHAMGSPEPAEPKDNDEPGTEVQPSIELSESVHTLTIVAKDTNGASVGAMVFERLDPLQDVDNPNGVAESQWFPVYAHGYFDVAGLTNDEVDERALAIADEIAGHPVASVIGCALKIAAAAALCMDGPAVVLTCPLGLHGVMCSCGPEVGISKADLKKFCDD